MDLELRPCRDEDLSAFFDTFGVAFGYDMETEAREHLARAIGPERMLCAVDGAEMVGVAGAFRFRLAVPGGALPAAGVTVVGVRPSHRRRGVLTAMMRRQLDDVRRWGEPLAILWASESSIYQRFGYGLATLRARIDIERDRALFRDTSPPVGRVRMVSVGQAAQILPDVYERARHGRPGMLDRSAFWWKERRLADPQWQRGGGGAMFRVVLDLEQRPEAYALYRVHRSWSEDGVPDGRLEVIEAMATSPPATREIWRFLFGVDLVARVQADRLSADHTLLLMLGEPRRLRLKVSDGIWIRLVDVRGALARRSYAGAGSLVLDVVDQVCPWNAGRWRLAAKPDRAVVESTTEPADLRLDVGDLGAAYLGGVSFRQLLRADRLEESRSGGAARADALFATDAAPWCPDEF